MPESQGRGLRLREEAAPPKWSEDTVAVFDLADNGYRDISRTSAPERPCPRGSIWLPQWRVPFRSLVRREVLRGPALPGVTETFLSVTLDAYKREIGSEFGSLCPGCSPMSRSSAPPAAPWTERLPETFERRWDTASRPISRLRGGVGDWKRVRHNYYQVLLEQFIERWETVLRVLRAERARVHRALLEHEWPNTLGVPTTWPCPPGSSAPGSTRS